MSNKIVNVPVDRIIFNHYQVDGTIDRKTVEEIKASLMQNKDNGSKGLLQITRGRPLEDGRYEQAFGRHRLIAFQELSQVEETLGFWDEMPLLVSELSDLEMFELMGIENFNRRNIDPVEEANIFHTYMTTDFNGTGHYKTSVDAAAKFGKSEEYVRQAIRVLHLPASAQDMLQAGTLTKSGARDLMVLQKVGGDGLVKDALDVIAARPDENISELIEDALRESDDTEWMNKNEEWFSASKHFPRKHLPALDSKTIGEVLETAEGYAKEDVGYLKEITRLVSAGMEFTDEAFPQATPESLERVRVLANPTPCEKCPLHAVMNGDHYCGLPLCMARKQKAWAAKVQEDKLNEIGVPMYQKSDGPFIKLSQYDDADQKLWKAKGADLRVMASHYEYNNFDGLGADLKAVLVGKAAEKRLKKLEEKKAASETESAARRNEAQGNNIKSDFVSRFTWEVASRAFEGALDGLSNTALLGIFAEKIVYVADFPQGIDEDDLIGEAQAIKKQSERAKELRRLVMAGMIGFRVRDDDIELEMDAKKLIVKHAENLSRIAAEWDVKLSKDFSKQAEQYQAELEAALKELK